MKKTVVVCVLVMILACMYSSVVFATTDEPWTGPSKAYWAKFVKGENDTLYVESDYQVIRLGGPTGYICAYYEGEQKMLDMYHLINGTWYSDKGMISGAEGFVPVESNHTLYDGPPSQGNIWYLYNPGPVYPFEDVEVNIVLPFDGYKDNSWLYSISVITTISDIEAGFDPSMLTVQIKQNGQPFGELYTKVVSNRVYEANGDWMNQLQLDVELPVGQNTVTVEYWLGDDMLASDTVNIERLSGFVDVDGDGKDDRTGQPDSSQKPIYESEIEVPEKPEDGDVLAWIRYIGEMIDYVFDMIFGSIRDFATGIVDGMRAILGLAQPMFSFVRQFFESFPPVMSAGIMALVTVATVLGILKLIRG